MVVDPRLSELQRGPQNNDSYTDCAGLTGMIAELASPCDQQVAGITGVGNLSSKDVF